MKKVGSVFLFVWGWGLAVAVPYFNWQYAKESGFARWLLLGEVVATVKASAWPYFLFEHFKAPHYSAAQLKTHAEIKKFIACIALSNDATRMTNRGGSLSPEDVRAFIRLHEQILQTGSTIDVGLLNSVYPEFGTHFKNQYLAGVQLILDGFKEGNGPLMAGQSLIDAWDDWYNSNAEAIRAAGRKMDAQ